MSHEFLQAYNNHHPEFLNLVELPPFRGVKLAATASRALERYSHLMDNLQTRSALRPNEIIDIADEFLDVVVIDRLLSPFGFYFTDLTLADLLSALIRSGSHPETLAAYRESLSKPEIYDLREAGRHRIMAVRKYSWYRRDCLQIPKHHFFTSLVYFPEELVLLMRESAPKWRKPYHQRFAVEMLNTVLVKHSTRIPLRGKRLPRKGFECARKFIWWDYRLFPREIPGVSICCYDEMLLSLPYVESHYFSPHYSVRNIFAHFRFTCLETNDRKVMVLDEVQSDWVRDLRWQRMNRELSDVRVAGNVMLRGIDQRQIPACPYERDWVEVAAEFIIYKARQLGCNMIVWTTGRIQHMLNPGLPLPAAERLYDDRIPEALSLMIHKLGGHAVNGFIDFPCYSTDLCIRWSKGHGWRVIRKADNEPTSGSFKSEGDAFQECLKQSQPIVERLPGFYIHFINSDEMVSLD